MSSSANAQVFAGYTKHNSIPRSETREAIRALIRDAYPEYYVTEVDERKISLREFAASGRADIHLDASDKAFSGTRDWSAVGEGMQRKMNAGEARDEFRFARFQYKFNGDEFIVYYLTYQDVFKSPDRAFFILYPRGGELGASSTCPPQTDALVLAAGKWTSQLHEEIFVFDDGRWEKSRELFRSVDGSSWTDVILDPDMKKGLIEDVQGFFDTQAVYKEFAVPWKRGVILHGVPGNGKTVSIKALMHALNQRPEPISSLYVKSFQTNCGTEQESIKDIFIMARSMAPCLLVFEDLDSLVHDKVRSYFLNEVDGLESNDGILMIGSTNHLDKLDPAISKRPSRFDRKYHFKLPEVRERTAYAMYWRNKLMKNNTVDYPEEVAGLIAQLTEGFSFAYMKELFVMALLSLVRGIKVGDDFEMVSEDDAKSPPREETPTPAPEVCTCAAICKDCKKPLPTEAAKEADEAVEAKQEAGVNKLVMPTVEIPEHLQDNLLLKVIKHQIRILHAEMDNSNDSDSKKNTESCSEC
ncbi:hypothetical protein HBI81_174530 [Parastagonospora nodorum]|nr:hypothetical protein HBI81_174530 [Parastagonospora nodorum]